jgi:dihydroxyacetone kinase-like protein
VQRAALQAALAGIQARGKAERDDKTMVDALGPATEALERSFNEGVSEAIALRECADSARAGVVATIPLTARKGRASYLGERSAGHQDPGATSMWLILAAAAVAWAR